MIEDEAKTKNCPLLGVATLIAMAQLAGEPGAASAAPVFDAGRRCEGSDCMMWRWDESRATAAGIEAGVAHGYCGVAPLYMSAPSQPLQGMSVPASIMRGKMGEPIGKGVYSNPQPGDADHGK